MGRTAEEGGKVGGRWVLWSLGLGLFGVVEMEEEVRAGMGGGGGNGGGPGVAKSRIRMVTGRGDANGIVVMLICLFCLLFWLAVPL